MQGYLVCWSSPPSFLQQVRTVGRNQNRSFPNQNQTKVIKVMLGFKSTKTGSNLKSVFFRKMEIMLNVGKIKLVYVIKYNPRACKCHLLCQRQPCCFVVAPQDQSCFFFFFSHKVTFTTRKSSTLTTSTRIFNFSNWFLLWQCSSTLASWASRKLMSLMRRQSKDFRLC